MVRWPTSVWTAYEKSTGVAPAGSAMTSPLGVKTKTSLRDRSKRRDSRNSPGSSVSFCQSRSWRSHAMSLRWSSLPVVLGVVRAHLGGAGDGLLLVLPVRGDAVLGAAVHVERADLEFDGLAVGADDRRVQRLVHVELGHRDVVLEPAGDRVPSRVHGAEGRVAVADGVHEDADAHQVVDLREVTAADDHLLVDAVVVLRAAGDGRLDAGGAQVGLDLVGHYGQVLVTLGRSLGDQPYDLVVHLGVEDREGEVLQFPLDGVHAQAVGERRVDLQRLARLLLLLLALEVTHGAHVVQPVGELDDQDARVLGHGDDHLAHGLGLRGLAELDLVELGDAVDEEGDLVAEVAAQVLQAVLGVLDGVVQQAGHQRGRVHAQLGEDRGHRERVRDVRVAALALLAAVPALGDLVGASRSGAASPSRSWGRCCALSAAGAPGPGCTGSSAGRRAGRGGRGRGWRSRSRCGRLRGGGAGRARRCGRRRARAGPAWGAAARPACRRARTGRARPARGRRPAACDACVAGSAAGPGRTRAWRRSGGWASSGKRTPRARSGSPVRLRSTHRSDPGLQDRLQADERAFGWRKRKGRAPDSSGTPRPLGVRRLRQIVSSASRGAPPRAASSRGRPAEEAQLHQDGDARDLGARPADELDRRLGGAAGGQDVVDDERPGRRRSGPRRAPRSRPSRTPGRRPGRGSLRGACPPCARG